MREKLQDLLKSEGLKPGQFAELLEINPAGVSHILAGRNKPGFDLLQKILRRFPRINPDWLLLDAENMYRDENGDHSAMPASSTIPTASDASGSLRQSHQPSAELFDVNPSAYAASPTATTSAASSSESFVAAQQLAQSASGNIKRIVILYNDNSFESFTPKNL